MNTLTQNNHDITQASDMSTVQPSNEYHDYDL